MEKEQKKCEHKFKHIIEKRLNLSNEMCLWLVHKCEKCGLRAHGILIEKIEEGDENVDSEDKS